jgi:apolipoprotein N-acyltransferase
MSQSSSVLPAEERLTRPTTDPWVLDSAGKQLGSHLCLAVAALLLVVSNGRWIIPAAAWISPIFLVRFLRTQRPLWGLCLAAVASICAALVSWWEMVPAPGVLYVLIVTLTALCQLLPYVIDRLLYRRLDGVLQTLILPTAWVSVEYVNSLFNPYGTWGAAGYTQVGNLSLMQMVSVTGVFGVGFLIAWFASVVNQAWENGWEWQRIRFCTGLFASVFAVVLLAGGSRLAFFPPTSENVRVASITASDELRNTTDPDRLAAELNVSIKESIPDVVWQALDSNARIVHEYYGDGGGEPNRQWLQNRKPVSVSGAPGKH